MSIYSYGYKSNESAVTDPPEQFQLFFNNLDLILEHEADILACQDYFFCTLPFAYCSWPYTTGDGQLFLGYLLLGWRENILTAPCTTCGGKVLVVHFGGSILSGRNKWHGICIVCRTEQYGSWEKFGPRADFVSQLRVKYPFSVSEWIEYDGYEFTWGGNGLKPARKKRLVTRQLADPVNLDTLIAEVRSGNIRQGSLPNVSKLSCDIALRIANKQGDMLKLSLN